MAGRREMYQESLDSDDSEGHLAWQAACDINRRMNDDLRARQLTGGQTGASTSIPMPPSPSIAVPASAISHQATIEEDIQWNTISFRQSHQIEHSLHHQPWHFPPGGSISRVSRPNHFGYCDWMDGVLNPNGHPSMLPNSGWGENPTFLWTRAVEYMNSGKALWLVQEAMIIPYHVQSYG